MSEIADFAYMCYERFTRNLKASFDGMAPEKWIRLVIIVGTYMLLRPYLLKLGGKQQMKQHEKEAAEAEAEAAATAKMSPNELRGHKLQLPEESGDDESDADEGGEGAAKTDKAHSSATEWGKKARRRQRTMIKKILEAEEKRLQDLQDDDEDKDIQEFLTD